MKYLKNKFNLKTKHIDIYKQAFIHKSYKHSFNFNNERLELLGDSVLNLIITKYLLEIFPDKNEGELSVIRSNIVRRDTLNTISKYLMIDSHLKYSKNIRFDDASKHSIFGNALEAFIGAVFSDKGYSITEKIVRNNIISPFFYKTDFETIEYNYKGRLLELCQQKRMNIKFDISETNVDGAQIFKVVININGIEKGRGEANRKKSAEQIASKLAYHAISI